MNNDTSHFVSIKKATEITGIGAQALRSFADRGLLPSYRTPSRQRKFDLAALQAMCNTATNGSQRIGTNGHQNFLYARVSSKKQMDDLVRQVEALKGHSPKYASFTILQDVGSGINFKRKGFTSILDACLHGTIGTVVVAHRDRLCRFGFDLVESLVSKAGGKVVVLNNPENKTSEQELADDLLSIVHIYSCRQMGRRKYSKGKRIMCQASNQTDTSTEENSDRMVPDMQLHLQ